MALHPGRNFIFAFAPFKSYLVNAFAQSMFLLDDICILKAALRDISKMAE